MEFAVLPSSYDVAFFGSVTACATAHPVGEAKKVFMVCRRKTISMPRIVSWLINQSVQWASWSSAWLLVDSAGGPRTALFGGGGKQQ